MAITVEQVGKQLSQRVSAAYVWPKLPWMIIGFGVLLRLVQFSYNPSLNFDEAGVSLNIINRSLFELREPLDYVQNAPLGFLVLQRLAVSALGNSELALRFLPLLFGIISLFLFYALAKHYLKPEVIFIPLWIFALGQPLINYSSLVKQYSLDVAIALLIALLATYIYAKGMSTRWLALYAVVGGLAVWFSHPAVFVLAGAGATLATACYSRKEWANLLQVGAMGAIWLVSFALTLNGSVGTVDQVFENPGLVNRLSTQFLPFPPTSLGDMEWYIRTFIETFKQPGGMFFPGLAALFFVVGGASLYSGNKVKFLLLASPIFFTLLASALGRYPLPGPTGLGYRFALFLVPFLLLFIGLGFQVFLEKVRPGSNLLAVSFIAFLCFSPLLSTAATLSSPRSDEEMKPIVSHIRSNWQPGDKIFALMAQPGFEYYAHRYGFNDDDYATGFQRHLITYLGDDQGDLAGVNLWMIYGHRTYSADFYDDRESITQYLDTIGTRIDLVRAPGVELEVYRLNGTPATSSDYP